MRKACPILRLAAMGLATLDAPVSGGTKGAGAASLTVMCSGDETVLARARPVLDAAKCCNRFTH